MNLDEGAKEFSKVVEVMDLGCVLSRAEALAFKEANSATTDKEVDFYLEGYAQAIFDLEAIARIGLPDALKRSKLEAAIIILKINLSKSAPEYIK